MCEVAIFIKTFLREETFLNCIRSIDKNLNNISYRLYVADDGEISTKKKEIYEKLRSNGHVVLELPFNTGASKSRNMLLKKLKNEEYILRMDDDFEICKETDLISMKKILDANNNIGAVADLERQIGTGKGVFSGEISPYQGNLYKEGTTLIRKMHPPEHFDYFTVDDIKYAKADFTRNMILIKKEVFNQISWDERFRFSGEHIDFLLQIKSSNWDLAFTPNSIHLHREDIQTDKTDRDYSRIKESDDKEYKLYKKKWGFDRIKIITPFKYKIKAGLVKLKKVMFSS